MNRASKPRSSYEADEPAWVEVAVQTLQVIFCGLLAILAGTCLATSIGA